MKHSTLKKALEKTCKQLENHKIREGRAYWQFGTENKIVKWEEDMVHGDAYMVHAYRKREEKEFDFRNDGFYGWYPKTIKSILTWLKEE